MKNRTIPIIATSFLTLIVAVSVFAGTEFTWKGSGFEQSFGNPAYWAVGQDEAGTNPDGLVPGPNDWIYYAKGGGSKQFYNLDDTTYTVKGISGYTLNWDVHDMSVRNGTLLFTDTFSNAYYKVIVHDTGHLAFGPNSVSILGRSGVRNSYDVHAGGQLTFDGAIIVDNLTATVADGGHFTVQPNSFAFHSKTSAKATSQQGQGFINAGTMNFPSGLTLGGTGELRTDYSPATFTIRQNAGTMILGGNMTRDGERGRLLFYLGGGTLDVTDDVAFVGLHSVEMDADATAIVSVSANKTCDVSPMVFNSGTSLTKTGAGTLVFGAHTPDALSAAGGVVHLTFSSSFPGELALADNTTLSLGAVSINADTVSGYENASFVVDASILEAGVGLLYSSNTAFLEAVHEKLTLPTGFTTEVANGALIVHRDMSDRKTFTSIEETNLSDASRWNVSPVPENEDVFVNGESTIAVLDASTPSFNSINVMGGATLKVSGSPNALPPITLTYNAKILFDDGIVHTLTPGAVAGVASERQIPVFEIATNAVITLPENYVFKNIDLHLYGQLTATSDIYFGTASADERSFFGMSVIGGKIAFTGRDTLYFASPVFGGSVRVPDKIYFKDVIWQRLSNEFWEAEIGRNNPLSEPFTMEFDGCFLDLRGNPSYIAGAATVSCVNGGGLLKEQFWPGGYPRVYVQDQARLLFDDGSSLLFTYNRNRFNFEPAEDGFEQLILKNGSYLAFHAPEGTQKAVATFEDSYWDVIRLPQPDINYSDVTNTRQWMEDAFYGLKAVNVPAGKFVGIRSSENWQYGIDWDREIVLDPNVPITGGGSLIVTNASPGYGMRAIVACNHNTATGEAKAYAGTDETKLVFADGANWAGTVVGSENIAFTNLTDSAAPAHVRFGALRFEGDMPIRIWKLGAAITNDFIELSLPFTAGKGGFAPVLMEGSPFEPGDAFTIGTYPASALPLVNNHAYTAQNWSLIPVATDDPTVVLLKIRYVPHGTQMILR